MSALQAFIHQNRHSLNAEEAMGLVSADREVVGDLANNYTLAAIAERLRDMAQAVTGDFRWAYLKAAELTQSDAHLVEAQHAA